MTEQELATIKTNAYADGYRQAVEDYTKALLESRREAFENAMYATGKRMDENLNAAVAAYTKAIAQKTPK